MRGSYYNEFDPFAAQWLRNLIAEGLIAPGDVDERSIKDVSPDDLNGYCQAHFFAGIGGWSLAARLAGWPDARPIWTGSCPCQPFSTAGKGGGVDDPRHLWPDFFRLIRACRPDVVMGEQVAGALGYGWLDGVRADLEGEDYACGAVDIPACAVDAPHIRQRLYWIAVADAGGEPRQQVGRGASGDEAADGREGWDRSQPDGDHRHCGDDESRGRLAHAGSGGPGRRALKPAGHVGHGDATGRDQGAGGLAGGDEGVALGYPEGLGWGEGRAEHGLRGGRSAASGADASGVAQGDACGQGLALGSVAGGGRGDVRQEGPPVGPAGAGSLWSRHAWIECHDGKARRVPEPGFPLLAHGVRGRVALGDAIGAAAAQIPEQAHGHLIHRVGAWRGFGNAIVPPLAAEVIAAWMEAAA